MDPRANNMGQSEMLLVTCWATLWDLGDMLKIHWEQQKIQTNGTPSILPKRRQIGPLQCMLRYVFK